jgi:TatD DNase family protein
LASPDLPPLDAHAHIATDVTATQVRRLQGAVIFAVTRSLSEAAAAAHGTYPNIIWGLGTHPGDRQALERYSPQRFEQLIPKFLLVGEIGLDRRAGHLDQQTEVFTDILSRLADVPVMVSIHSTGAVKEVLAVLDQYPVRAPILHWFGGTPAQTKQAAHLGAWFSVNAVMTDDALRNLPVDRVITETDFPFTRRAGSSRPGATDPIENRLAHCWECDNDKARLKIWRNLGGLVRIAGVEERLPGPLVNLLQP